MNKDALVVFGENLLQMLKSESGNGGNSIKSINDCLLGTTIIKAVISEIEGNVFSVIESMNAMAGEKLIIRGVDFNTIIDSEGDYVLRLNYVKFYDRFMEYCSERGVSHPIFTLKEFKTLLRIQSYCKDYSWPAQFDCIQGGHFNKKLYRAAILKIHDLKSLGVNVNFLIQK